MQVRWFLSKTYKNSDFHNVPFAGDYGGRWSCPIHTPGVGGWELVQVYVNSHQLEAIAQDPRIITCPLLFDPRPVPDAVITAYAAQGATSGMNLATLLATLSDTTPHYGYTI